MKYLKQFETTAAYNAAKPNLILPNVSLITENNKVEYNPSSPTPPTPSHDYVDLGLPSGTLWAKYNVGATSETEYGNYYQYGKGADDYSVTSGQSDYDACGYESPLPMSADTATQVWDSLWHTPTKEQIQELTANTTCEWTTINGVNGGKFTATNGSGNYIFIPAAGYYEDGVLNLLDEQGYAMSSYNDCDYAYYLNISNNRITWAGINSRFIVGLTVRPVTTPQTATLTCVYVPTGGGSGSGSGEGGNSTQLFSSDFINSIESMKIDGNEQSSIVSTYDFGDTSEHTVTLNLKNGVTSIGDYAFAGCNSLTSIDIPSGVTSIGQGAFSECYSLTSIDISSGVTSIGDFSFVNCSSLTSVTAEATTPPTLGTDALVYTNNCPIYVPSESVDAYKVADGWKDYASRIQSIA